MMRRLGLTLLFAVLAAMALAPAAQAAFDDPLFIFRPKYTPPPPPAIPPPPLPPPDGDFEGPCGLAVDALGNFYVSDYYHDAVDFFTPVLDPDPKKGGGAYFGQLAGTGLLQGPCAIALDGLGNLYVNNFHSNVVRFTTSPFNAGTVVDSANSTGVAVNPTTNNAYVNERTQVGVYDPGGVRLGQIGAGSITDGYGLAVSGFPATQGRIYVPDAATETVKVYESTLGSENPVAVISGTGTPAGHFTSLRNAAVAVDNASGEVYVADNLQPEYSERGETVVYVFSAAGAYEGRLKYSVENGLPPGLAVDNSGTTSQGRVYVTSGNTELGTVYAYRAHAATTNAVPLPVLPPGFGVGSGGGTGSGAVTGLASAPSSPVAGSVTSLAADTSEAVTARRAVHRAHRKAKHARHKTKHQRAKEAHRKNRHQRRGNR
jgi:hypothetical protein